MPGVEKRKVCHPLASVLEAGALDPMKILGIRYFLKYKRVLENGQL